MTKLSEIKQVREFVAKMKEELSQKGLDAADTFERCFTNTLDKTIRIREDGTTFVITGDIPAMWLRDSACQVKPYLFLAKESREIRDMLLGVLRQQMKCILLDPYANAFNEKGDGACWAKDLTEMKPGLWERKFEIDSLCFPMELAYLYWKNSGDTSVFDEEFLKAAKKVVEVFHMEQDHEHRSAYTFQRENCVFTDTLSRGGKGALVNPECGLIWSGFRPSDDACVYGYLIPSNMFAAVILEYLSRIAADIYQDLAFAKETEEFARQLREAIETYAKVPVGGERFDTTFYAYEVDGYGQYQIMDDANLPSLLSIPYFGYKSSSDACYQSTKSIILSSQNPYYYEGTYAKGIGSIHTKTDYIWHLSCGMQGLVAETEEEKRAMLEQMLALDGGTGWMHESICVNDPKKYTRPWFSWANAIFAELALDYCGYHLKK